MLAELAEGCLAGRQAAIDGEHCRWLVAHARALRRRAPRARGRLPAARRPAPTARARGAPQHPSPPRLAPRSKLEVLQSQLHVATYTSEAVPALRAIAGALGEEEAAARGAVERVRARARGGGARGASAPRALAARCRG